jgi:hypothetical protein
MTRLGCKVLRKNCLVSGAGWREEPSSAEAERRLILGELISDAAPRESPRAEPTAEDIFNSRMISVEVP